MSPLQGLKVLDFSTLLPGPLASLILAEAGAQVIKVERPGVGDEMRTYTPQVGGQSVNFVMLNRGKESLALDLKSSEALQTLRPLIEQADVVIEQFRPGVMARLGLGYEQMREMNPRLIYCSISGWGQTGPKANIAAHDLNYVAESGMLSLCAGADGAPVLPPLLAADIAGGALPAVMNIMFALRERDQTGAGRYLDISMSDNLFVFNYWGIGNGRVGAGWPRPAGELLTGGSPRYQIYRTADSRYVAVAALEDRFWFNFARLIDLPESLRDAAASAEATIAAVAERIGARTAAQWREAFAGQDVCCSIVATLEEAVNDPHTAARGLLPSAADSADTAEPTVPVLPVPLAAGYRAQRAQGADAPALGEHNGASFSA